MMRNKRREEGPKPRLRMKTKGINETLECSLLFQVVAAGAMLLKSDMKKRENLVYKGCFQIYI